MFFLGICITFLIMSLSPAQAEITEADNNALSVFGSACEEVKKDEPNTSTRVKATDKACYSAITSLPQIVSIRDNFDDHDFNVIVYNIIDEYLEDLDTKTTQQDGEKICIEISGYITPENIGKAIDEAIKMPEDTPSESQSDDVLAENSLNSSPTSIPANNSHIVVLSTVYVRPTEFYNNTQSHSHSRIFENIIAQSENIKLVKSEDEANFIVTPKILKAKIEPLNKETSRLQMVLALEILDKNKNSLITEHENKFILFNTSDDEQTIAKTLLRQLFEQGSVSVLSLVEKSSYKAYEAQTKTL